MKDCNGNQSQFSQAENKLKIISFKCYLLHSFNFVQVKSTTCRHQACPKSRAGRLSILTKHGIMPQSNSIENQHWPVNKVKENKEMIFLIED